MHKFQIPCGSACLDRQRQPAAIGIGRIAGLRKQPTNATGRQNHGPPMHNAARAIGFEQAHATHTTIAQHQAIHIDIGAALNVRRTARRRYQGLHHLRAGRIATGMHDARTVVTAFTAQLQPTFGITIKHHALLFQPVHRIDGTLREDVHHRQVVMMAASHAGIARMVSGMVTLTYRGGDSTLCHRAGRTFDALRTAQYQHRRGCYAQRRR